MVKAAKPLSCDACQKSFSRKGDLNRHKLLHTGVRPYVCPICRKAFAQKGQLNTHMHVHTGNKPFQCKQCEASFGDPSSAIRHEREKHGTQQFQCPIKDCTSRIKRRTAFKNHLRKKHSIEPEDQLVDGCLTRPSREISVESPSSASATSSRSVSSASSLNRSASSIRARPPTSRHSSSSGASWRENSMASSSSNPAENSSERSSPYSHFGTPARASAPVSTPSPDPDPFFDELPWIPPDMPGSGSERVERDLEIPAHVMFSPSPHYELPSYYHPSSRHLGHPRAPPPHGHQANSQIDTTFMDTFAQHQNSSPSDFNPFAPPAEDPFDVDMWFTPRPELFFERSPSSSASSSPPPASPAPVQWRADVPVFRAVSSDSRGPLFDDFLVPSAEWLQQTEDAIRMFPHVPNEDQTLLDSTPSSTSFKPDDSISLTQLST